MKYKQKKTPGVMSKMDTLKPMQYEDVGLMFVMPPLVEVTVEEADRQRREFGRTKQEILDGGA